MNGPAFKPLTKEDVEYADRFLYLEEASQFWLFFDDEYLNGFHYITIAQVKHGMCTCASQFMVDEDNGVWFRHYDEHWRSIKMDGLASKILEVYKERLFYKDLEKTLNE